MQMLSYITLILLTLTANIGLSEMSNMETESQHLFQLRFSVADKNIDQQTIDIDIELKAQDEQASFYMGSANFRFRYNDKAITAPTKVLALAFEGVKGTGTDGFPISYLPPHNMSGTTGNIVSYNTFYSFGEGVMITDIWQAVGRIRFRINDPKEKLDLEWLFDGEGAGQGTVITRLITSYRTPGKYDLQQILPGKPILDLSKYRISPHQSTNNRFTID